MWNLSEVEVEAASKEAEGVFASDSGVFKHKVLPHNCLQETELPSESDVYFISKYSQAMGHMCISVFLCVSVCMCAHISQNSITTHSATD